MDKLLRKELIGRVYKPHGYNNSVRYVIVGVRKNPRYEYWFKESGRYFKDYNYYEILIGRLYENHDRTWSNVSVMSWVAYMGSKHICFDGRGTRRAIRRCVKSGQYDKLHYHTGRKINMNVAHINETHGKYYEEYIRECIDRDDKRG